MCRSLNKLWRKESCTCRGFLILKQVCTDKIGAEDLLLGATVGSRRLVHREWSYNQCIASIRDNMEINYVVPEQQGEDLLLGVLLCERCTQHVCNDGKFQSACNFKENKGNANLIQMLLFCFESGRRKYLNCHLWSFLLLAQDICIHHDFCTCIDIEMILGYLLLCSNLV